ncbi:MAG TPA: energy transducer TonB [Flavobacteriales bacterium]|nr:energy transducer TonB [Flavobacteriales bacterium]
MGVSSDEMVRGDSLFVPEQHDPRDSIVGTTQFDLDGIPYVIHAFADAHYKMIDAGILKIEIDGFGIVYSCGTFSQYRSWLSAINDSANALIRAALKATEQPGFVPDSYKNCLPLAEHEKLPNRDGSWDMEDVEIQPEYPGGYEKLLEDWASIQQYPDSELAAGIGGKVLVSFTVHEDGSVNDIQILRGVSPGLDEEAKRLVGSMQNWTPAKVKDSVVQCRVVLPINFKIR